VTAVVPSLAEKAQSWIPGLRVALVPNGVAPDSFDMSLPARPLPRGEITVGYFGYLTPAWFDWELVASTARKHPRWVFHIVGYGEPVPVRLPDNVHLLGKVPHIELFAFAQSWDVAIVPFKVGALSQGADPIKVYEYLTLGLPVVSTGIPHLRAYPGVYAAEQPGDFARCIEKAARKGIDRKKVKSFVDAATWYQRGLGLIRACDTGKGQAQPGWWLSGKGGAD
jgi:glycosyltransferase involved in cell wall biosynthesis